MISLSVYSELYGYGQIFILVNDQIMKKINWPDPLKILEHKFYTSAIFFQTFATNQNALKIK